MENTEYENMSEKERLEMQVDNLTKEIKGLILLKASNKLSNAKLIDEKKHELVNAKTSLKLAEISEEKGRVR